jgi:hypothetical protein
VFGRFSAAGFCVPMASFDKKETKIAMANIYQTLHYFDVPKSEFYQDDTDNVNGISLSLDPTASLSASASSFGP